MTWAAERRAIETYIAAEWTATPIGFDGQTFAPVADSIALTINSGAVLQGSIGRASNVLFGIGTLTVAIYTDGADGSAAWRGYADTLSGLLRDVRLDADGVPGTADVFIRFSPPQIEPQHHPYIAASFKAAPFHVTNLIAPFVRYDLS